MNEMVTLQGQENIGKVTAACAKEGLVARLSCEGVTLGVLYAPGRENGEPEDLVIDSVPGVQVCHIRSMTELGSLFLNLVVES
jgi:hypothetical protein